MEICFCGQWTSVLPPWNTHLVHWEPQSWNKPLSTQKACIRHRTAVKSNNLSSNFRGRESWQRLRQWKLVNTRHVAHSYRGWWRPKIGSGTPLDDAGVIIGIAVAAVAGAAAVVVTILAVYMCCIHVHPKKTAVHGTFHGLFVQSKVLGAAKSAAPIYHGFVNPTIGCSCAVGPFPTLSPSQKKIINCKTANVCTSSTKAVHESSAVYKSCLLCGSSILSIISEQPYTLVHKLN